MEQIVSCRRPAREHADAFHRLAATATRLDPLRALRWPWANPPIEQRQDAFPLRFRRRTPPAEVTDAMEARGQHMLQEAAQELGRLQRHRFPCSSVTGFILEGGASVFFLEDALRRERGALHVAGQVAQRFLAGPDGLRVDDPFLLPHDRWNLREKFGAQ